MKKKIFLLCAFLVLVTVGCNDSGEPKEETPWVQQIYPLAGTKWQVSKVIHTKTGAERPIFVGDDICTPFVPILDFATDTTGIIYIDYNDIEFRGYEFNLSDDSWYKKYDARGYPSNIVNFMFTSSIKEWWLGTDYNRYFGYIGYKLEGKQLKFYQHDDGFFYFNPDGITMMYPCYVTPDYIKYVTDSNWYNCIVFEEVK